MHISFLISNAYGIGGTVRTTFNLARALAEQHDVEVVSVLRHRDVPPFDPGSRLRLRHLVDLRKDSATYEGDEPAFQRPSRLFPPSDNRHTQYSELTDFRIAEYLRTLEADIVVGTRPGLNVHIAEQTRRGPVRVGQEHLTLGIHPRPLRVILRDVYPRLDAVTTLTEADARAYRAWMRLPGVRIEALPNAVPEPGVEPSDGRAKWVIAAGRLAPVKRYDVLVQAFAKVVRQRPDWRLRIYGGGGEREKLRALIDELGLYNHVFLMGPARPLEPEWAKGSIAAVTSNLEGFGMTIVEAMRCGLPVVSTDCPYGPGEIIADGVDGRLVPVGRAGAVANALLDLINDDEARRRMGRAALVDAARFDPSRIAGRYEQLFGELIAGVGSRVPRCAIDRTRGALLGVGYFAKDAARAVLRKVRTT